MKSSVSKQALDDLLDSLGDAIYEINENGKFIYANKSLCSLVDVAKDDIVKRCFFDFIHVSDKKKFKEYLAIPPQNQSREGYFELRMVVDKKKLFLVGLKLTIEYSNGKITKIRVVSRDLSAIRSYKKLGKHVYENFIKKIPKIPINKKDIVWALDSEYRFLYFNNVFKYFYQPNAILSFGDTINWEQFKGVDFNFSPDKLKEIIQKGKSYEWVTQIIFEGEHKVFQNTADVVFGANGTRTGLSVIGRDITNNHLEGQRQQVFFEKGLQMFNEIATSHLSIDVIFEKTLKSACEFFEVQLGIITNIEGDKYEILHFYQENNQFQIQKGDVFSIRNTYCEFSFKNESVLLIDKNPSINFSKHPCYGSELVEAYLGCPIKVDGKYVGNVNFSTTKSRSKKFDDYDGEYVRLFANWVGVVLKQRNAYQLVKSEKIEAEKAKSSQVDFLNMMSHEIRTPLNVIIGITHILFQSESSTSKKERLGILKKSSEHLQSMVSDILDFSKIQDGMIELENIEFDLSETIKNIISTYETQTEEKNIYLKTEVDSSLNGQYYGDPIRINQILHNLVSNAVKFTNKGGIIIKCVKKNTTKAYDLINIRVVDTGIGIEENKTEDIFGSFSQANKTITRKFGGSGLGLSITKQLLSMMGSQIKVLSRLGQGSTFEFDLLLKRGIKVDFKKKETKGDETFLMGTVLIVDDNEFNQVIAKEFAESHGLTVYLALNGMEAIKTLENKIIDLVLLDIQMPVMDGFETIKWIRSQDKEYFIKLPVVAMTASATAEIQKQVFETGMNDYIPKPFMPSEFFSKVKKNIESRNFRLMESSLEHLKHSNPKNKHIRRLNGLLTESISYDQVDLHKAIKSKDMNAIADLVTKHNPVLKSMNLMEIAEKGLSIKKMIERNQPKPMIIFETHEFNNAIKALTEQLSQFKKAI